jgi:membrane-associated protease RseP (regulator of RpoE activity)
MLVAPWLAAGSLFAQATTQPEELRSSTTQSATESTLRLSRPIFIDSVMGDKVAFRRFDRMLEKGPFIGVSASPVPPVLRDQLQLKPGIGLVVDFVAPDSPAEKAGLRRSDVIEKLDDQLLVNPQQLAVLVRTRKPGDELKLAVIRAASPQAISVTVGEGDVPPLEDVLSSEGVVNARGLLKPAGGSGGGGHFGHLPFHQPGAAMDIGFADKEHQFHITQGAGGRQLEAKDTSGKLIFKGPIGTKEQLEKLPPEIREKVKRLESKWLEQPLPPQPPAPPRPPVPPTPPVAPAAPKLSDGV